MAVRTQRNTILLKGRLSVRYDEAPTSVAIYPGMLIELSPTNQARPHSTVDAPNVEHAVALEDSLQGNTVDVPYAVGDVCRFQFMQRSNEFQGLIKAGSAALVVGDYVQSNGDGTFKKLAAGKAMARVLEAIDNSAGATNVLSPLRSL